jgi:predicted ester cyclase
VQTAEKLAGLEHNGAGEVGARNIKTFRRLIAQGLAGGDLAVTREILNPEIVDHQDYGPGFPAGLAGVLALEATLKIAIPDMNAEIEEIVAVGNETWARVRAWGTFTGPYLGIPPTGKKIDIIVVESIRWGDDGRVEEHWGVADRFGLMVDMGLIPEQAIPVFRPELVKGYVSPGSGEPYRAPGSAGS